MLMTDHILDFEYVIYGQLAKTLSSNKLEIMDSFNLMFLIMTIIAHTQPDFNHIDIFMAYSSKKDLTQEQGRKVSF